MTDDLSRRIGSVASAVRRCFSSLWRWEAQFKGVQIEGKAVFWGRPLISVAKGSCLVLGENVQLASALRSNPLGCFQPCVLRTLAPGARLVLNKNVGASGAVICAGLSIEIGEGTIIGSGAMVLDNDFHVLGDEGWLADSRSAARPIKIGRNVFIGARAILLKGVTVGDRAIIGAGAVVTKNVPEGYLAVGNPAAVFPRRLQTQSARG